MKRILLVFIAISYFNYLSAQTSQLGVSNAPNSIKLAVKEQAKPVKNSSNSIYKAKKLLQKVTLLRGESFTEWKANKVPKKRAKKTFLAILNQPKREQVEQVIFISAGQQTANPNPSKYQKTRYGYANVLTGQEQGYRKPCVNKQSCVAVIRANSLADSIIGSNLFDKNKTLIILAFDSQFNHTVKEATKIKIENAFWDLLTNRFDSGKVKSIALIGQSKGGCLSFSLGKRFRQTSNYEEIPLIIQGYDPVCKSNRLTQASTNQYYSNPLVKKPSFKSLSINMNLVFPNDKRKHLAILNIHSGAPVFANTIHSFTFKSNNTDLGWWKQRWVPYEHTDMGGNLNHKNDTVIPGFKHLIKYKNQFGDYIPSGLSSNKPSICPKFFPNRLGEKNNKFICMAKKPLKISSKRCVNRNSPGKIWASKYCIWHKKSYWHARPLKKIKTLKCPLKLSRKVDTYNNKPVCMSVAPRKIKQKKCSTQYNGRCVWNKGEYYKARPLK